MRPVFVGGCSRSGSTLLGAMLGAHSRCITTPESQFKFDVLRLIARDGQAADPVALARTIARHPRFRIWNIAVDPDETVRSGVEGYSSTILWFVRQYATTRAKDGADVWVDHSTANLRHGVALLQRFPDTRFLHIVRDGRAVAASVLPLDWGPNTIHHAAHWWTGRLVHGLAAESTLLGRIRRVSYEGLVRSPETTLRELCSFLELDYEPAMLEARGFDVPTYTAMQHQLVGRQPDPTRLDRWESQLTPRQVEIFESLTGDLLPLLGYSLWYGAAAHPVRWRERLGAYLTEAVRGLMVNTYRRRRRFASSVGHRLRFS